MRMPEEKNVCYPWSINWAKSIPDPIVRKEIEKGFIDPSCLSPERRRSLGLIKETEKKEEVLEE